MKFTTLLLAVIVCYTVSAQTSINEIELQLTTDTGYLYGSLTTPNNKSNVAAIIIPGSGATDRNCNAGFSLYTNAYKQLAEQLANNGISSLRFDKRGIGKSKDATIPENEMRFDNFIDDVVKWIKVLKTEHHFTDIYIIGHSQGSLIGMIAAQKTDIKGYISVNGAGRSIDLELKDQLRRKLPDKIYDEAALVLDTLKMGQPANNISPYFYSLFRPSLQPYMISWIQYEPAIEITKLQIPVLLIHGSTDIQVSVDNVNLLYKAAPNSQLMIIEGMNHVLKDAPTEQKANMATYMDGTLPVKEELVNCIVEFIRRN